MISLLMINKIILI